jgi:hypothetical protein
MLAIEDREPDAEHEESAGERNEMRGIEQVESAAGEREHWKGPNTARTLAARGEEVLER